MSARGTRRVIGSVLVGFAALCARDAGADAMPARAVVDRAVVRFYAAETGGTTHPRFVGQRMLAFEARLEALAEKAGGGGEDGIGEGYEERHLRAALDHHVGEEMLASLAQKLIAGSPPSRRPSLDDLGRIGEGLDAALFERLGGRSQVEAAAAAEQLDASDLAAILDRQTLAAWYLDRAVSPLLQPTEEQLREVFRTSAHPYRGRPFDEVRSSLARWFVLERLRVAETAFFQGARTRVVVIVTR